MSPYGDEDSDLFVPGQIRGYRAWRVSKIEEGLLVPTYSSMLNAWCPSSRGAVCDLSIRRCEAHFGAPPAPGCTCGFYASYDPKSYRAHLPRIWHADSSLIIHGSIIGSGRVVTGTKGFRAEFARVEALWGWRGTRISLIAEYYGVPWFWTKRSFLRQFPPHDVSALLED